jgi:hypothetical protein
MNISSQDRVSIKISAEEIKNVLLDYIKRMAGGMVDKDMVLEDDPFGHVEKGVEFVWKRARTKEVK